jgi:hypothetical protein
MSLTDDARRGIALSRALVSLVQGHFPQVWGDTGSHDNWPVIAATLLAKITRSLEAMCLLRSAGFSADATIILRSQFEHAVTLAWLATAPSTTIPLWLKEDARARLAANTALGTMDEPMLNAEEHAHFSSLVAKTEAWFPTVEAMAREADRHWAGVIQAWDLTDHKHNFSGLYQVVYRFSSAYVHPRPVGLNNSIASPLDGVVAVTGEVSQVDEPVTWGPLVLVLALLVSSHALGWPGEAPVLDAVKANPLDPAELRG